MTSFPSPRPGARSHVCLPAVTGAGANLIDPARPPALTRTAHTPSHGRDTRRDDCSQRHCPHLITPDMGTDPDNWITVHGPGLPFPRHPIIGLPAGHLKDACGAAVGGRALPGP
jgi:hypothetical protein